MPNILAILSQFKKIYWNMLSKVLGQFEANWFVIPISQKYLLEMIIRDAKELKGQSTIKVT